LLTGLEADADALTEAVTLHTHTRDVVALLEREELHNVVLVGHSYAGMIITGAAEHIRQRIAHLVYIDAFAPDHGQSALQLLPESIRDAFRKQAEADGGWRLRSSDRQLDLWGLEDGPPRDFVKARLCDFSIRCFEQPLAAPTHAAKTLKRTYISCVREGYPAKVVFDPFAARARQEGWCYHELPTGHAARPKCRLLSASCFSTSQREANADADALMFRSCMLWRSVVHGDSYRLSRSRWQGSDERAARCVLNTVSTRAFVGIWRIVRKRKSG
jgi:pimeloyl-ACP methyl ester carboxylesterase